VAAGERASACAAEISKFLLFRFFSRDANSNSGTLKWGVAVASKLPMKLVGPPGFEPGTNGL
jgi:hypothetical protein